MSLHVETRGASDGVRAVLLHGTSGRGSDMFDFFGDLPGYQFSAPDRTNYGDSPQAPDGIAAIDEDADQVAVLLGSGGHLLGVSYGAVVALVTASRYPDRVRTLTVHEPPAFHLAGGDPSAEALIETRTHSTCFFLRASSNTRKLWAAKDSNLQP